MLCFAFFLLLEPFFLRADKEIFRVFPQGVEALLVKGDAENVREKFFLSFQDVESLSKDCDGDIVFTTASGKTLCISNSSQYYSKISKVFQDFKEKNGQVRN